MAVLYGRNWQKRELLQRMGGLDQVASIRRLTYQEGLAQGLQAFEVHNADLQFNVLIDRCFDIGSFYYRGIPLSFLAKSGLTHAGWHPTGPMAGKSIMGGLLFTCGLSNVGPMEIDDQGGERPKHGLIRTTAASNPSAWGEWEGDDYVLRLRGEVRETGLFESNLVLRRTIETTLGEPAITIVDEIENEGFRETPLMLLYHCNLGFPLLDDLAYLDMNPRSTLPRDAVAAAGLDQWSKFGSPVDTYQEQVFYHEMTETLPGEAQVDLVSPRLGFGLRIAYSLDSLPYLVQWKSLASGDFVCGIEPANCHPEGQDKERANQTLRFLQPGEKVKTRLKISVI